MTNLKYLFILILAIPQICGAQKINKDWWMEAEAKDSKVSINNGIIDIIAPKGLTLWYNHLMKGNTVIEYEAQIKVDDNNTNPWNRLSDLNCFWFASDPTQKDGNVIKGATQRGGIFVNQYALQLYYMGYGGNHNTTTRFRRYDGDTRGVSDANARPSILREYTDANHLLKPNHWYKVRLEQIDGRVRYTIDGECLVDYTDLHPLTSGYFGFRTTLAHAQLRNFSYSTGMGQDAPIQLSWIGGKRNTVASPQTFGVPFAQGEVTDETPMSLTSNGTVIPSQQWTLAHWPDGSVKWKAVAAVIPAETEACTLQADITVKKGKSKTEKTAPLATQTANQIIINTGATTFHIPLQGTCIIDSILKDDVKVGSKTWIEVNGTPSIINKVKLEQNGSIRSCVKVDGDLFTLRMYAYRGSDELKIVHTLLVDSALNRNGMSSLGLRANIPLRDENQKRVIAFATDGNDYMPQGLLTNEQYASNIKEYKVKPLVARRNISTDAEGNITDPMSKRIANDIASWDGFRLSQLTANAFTLRKRATSSSPWIGTAEGHRATGRFSVLDTKGGLSLALNDFWQSHPSTLQVDNARANEATASIWLWSPEAEKMCFEHYDTIAHGLDAAYEDVQEGMSTAYGIARTSTIFLKAIAPSAYGSKDYTNRIITSEEHQLTASPEYMHRVRAFGIWSLPSADPDSLDRTLARIMKTYDEEVERNSWYGYFNYGDFMHSYDSFRGEWRYDVGGYAWDNTELASNTMLWYNYLRTGDADAWRMAVAMSRHTAEVDCYHYGPNAGLGSRHNVSHWGCGAKEARISQAHWNRFLYYITADERTGDLMTEVVDADQKLYALDPMRLAQPRSDRYPCTAPARLRVGPDWIAYAGNWFTEWERTGNKKYYDKILAGMKSIASLPHGIFSGPKALGYDPATGIVSWEGDTAVQNTNHLLSIMGGFEMMNEMMLSINDKEWNKAWFEHARDYRDKALTISRNRFRIPRLQAYAYWLTGNEKYKQNTIDEMKHTPFSAPHNFFTNDAATWSLDAIFWKEVSRQCPIY